MSDQQNQKNIDKAIQNLNNSMSEREQRSPISFEEFLKILAVQPATVMRNIFQVFHDMLKHYIGGGIDEYPDDPESINYVYYDCAPLFVDGADRPFFADRLFANRLVNLAESFKRGAQQNKIHIFEGPPGCGKSTFLNNLLRKFEEYTHSENGTRYETVWRIDRSLLGGYLEQEINPGIEKLLQLLDNSGKSVKEMSNSSQTDTAAGDYLEIACPSHDNPILMIPKHFRRAFFDDLFRNDEFKWKLSTEKEYDWIFRDVPCTICSSLYSALLGKLNSPLQVFRQIFAQPYQFNRRLGKGISVFNPGDRPMRETILTNPILQRRINSLLRDSNQVAYIYSRHAKTNNGIYALMDIKSHNTDRLIELHNIISEGVHKVEDIEENVNSLFLAVMNPEDKPNIQEFQSFLDRIEYITIPYVMELDTEVQIYRNTFGSHIDANFLPRVLENFARAIISSRLNEKSEALLEWIGDPDKYKLYCDKNLMLLKMEIYSGRIPAWLLEEDRKRFTAKRRRNIIDESEKEGGSGISGRDSIKIFNEFYSTYGKEDNLINMSMLCQFFHKLRKSGETSIPEGFLESLLQMYDYTVLQEVKEALYFYNEEQISRNLQNYIFAVNFEPGAVETSSYTKDRIEISEEWFESIEAKLMGAGQDKGRHYMFRKEIQKTYTSRTLTQEIILEGKRLTETALYGDLRERYIHNLKEKVLDPFLKNENFRRAIKDFDKEEFKTYDSKIQEDVNLLMENLYTRFAYSKKGAQEICIYVIDNDLAKRFAGN
ncbi:MAG: serine protein kinase PrkA [Thermodesulfobacteriota bacterium]